MSRIKFPVWQTVLVVAIFSFCNCETNFAQSINGFSKSSRGYGPSAAARPGGGQRSSSYRGSGQSRGTSRSYQGRSNGSRSYSNSSRNRNSSQRYNRSFYPSRSVIALAFQQVTFTAATFRCDPSIRSDSAVPFLLIRMDSGSTIRVSGSTIRDSIRVTETTTPRIRPTVRT